MYSVGHVEFDDALRDNLRQSVVGAVDGIQGTMEYDFLTEDRDGRALCLDLESTDFTRLGELLGNGTDAPRIREVEAFRKADGYLVKLQHREEQLWCYRKVSAGWTTKGKKSLLWDEQRLRLLDAPEIVRIDERIDCLVYDRTVFVLEKSAFESGMNYRDRMRCLRDGAIKELADAGVFSTSCAEQLRRAVGENIHHMRRLSSIKQNGFHRSEGYLDRLGRVNEEEQWGLRMENGRLVFDPDCLDDILRVLNNDRLKSPLDDFTYDVGAKQRFATRA